MKNARLLWVMILFESKRFSAFPLEIVASILGQLFEILLYMMFWLLIGKLAGSGDIVQSQVVSYYLIISGVSSLFFTDLGLASELMKTIKSGNLSQALIRPTNPLFVPFSQRVGRSMLRYIIGIIEIVAGIVITGGLSFAGATLLPLVVFNTLVINVALNVIIGTIGLYIVEASGLKNTAVHISRLCGGVMMPLYLMPPVVAATLQWTPFPAAQYHLAALLQGVHKVDLLFVIVGSVWAVALMAFALWFWRRSLGRYEAIGI